MNVKARLEETCHKLRQRNEAEARLFISEAEKVFTDNGFPVAVQVFLHVLDDRPW